MDETVDVTIPVDAEAAALLSDPHNRAVVGRLVSRVLRPDRRPTNLERALSDLHAQVEAAGLTADEVDAELAAHKAERRARRAAI